MATSGVGIGGVGITGQCTTGGIYTSGVGVTGPTMIPTGGTAICPPVGQFGAVGYDQSFAYGQGLGYSQAYGQGVGINQTYGYGQGVGLTTPTVVGGSGYLSQGVGFTPPGIGSYNQRFCWYMLTIPFLYLINLKNFFPFLKIMKIGLINIVIE